MYDNIIGYPTFVHTDHARIRYLMNKPVTPGHVTRWLLLLKEFQITIIDKPNKDNVVVDFLSRLDTNDEGTPAEDIFRMNRIFKFLLILRGMKILLIIFLQGRYPRFFHTTNNERSFVIVPIIHG